MMYLHHVSNKKVKESLRVAISLFTIERVQAFLVVGFPKLLVGGLLYPSDLEDNLEEDSSLLGEVILDVG